MSYSGIPELDVMVVLPKAKKGGQEKVYKINKKGGEAEA